ncbi:histidine kinase [Nocardia sp. CDC159]|uniref:histidine kinase n=1 Tax=Nocardia pulmonis TaxID=2951408 RepID=A0A9X2IZX8_9NOCA|nr:MULTISPECIES: histidine kinase [Nocardia]MCM6776560.1 histidine kinase [Nocardia pulmonis]MCM6788984.1 histidine kinase [Nocardia sp. CDC159]
MEVTSAAAATRPPRIRDRIVEFLRDPVETFRRTAEAQGYDYPPSVILVADICVALTAVAAAALRHDYFSTGLPFLATLILILVFPVFFLFDVKPKPVVYAVTALVATGLFLAQPVYPDCASLVLTVAAGELAAIIPRKSISFAFTVVAVGEVLVFYSIDHVDRGLPMYATGIVLGWMVGLMLQLQRRSLYQERENQEIRATQAANEERRRIAREVHDVIAHSLSITLLHLTAARHALQTDRDVDEAVDALTDAERLGRQAMTDIRRTVGLLDQAPTNLRPEPGLDDIADLVDDFVRAGLDLDYRLTGEVGLVSAATGLTLFRICQESLANVAKHAPGARVTLRIEVTAAAAAASIANTLPDGPPARRGRGMGISGMTQRATLVGGTLSAGPKDDRWVVHAQLPVDTPKSGLMCLLTGQDDPLRVVREAITSVTRKLQEGM